MKNLAVTRQWRSAAGTAPNVEQLAINVDTEGLYSASSGAVHYHNDELTEVVDQHELVPEASLCGPVVALQHLALLECVNAVTALGQMYNIEPLSHEVELVGEVPGGIEAAAWSPDEEFLVTVTCNQQLLMLTKDMDVLIETPARPTDYGLDQPVTLGWGKAETQFQGKAGKLSSRPRQVEAAVPFDDGRARISWRGDGEFLATSTLDEDARSEGHLRKLRIWRRDGTLSATAERVPGLESCLAWQPSGRLIATSQRLPSAHHIVFFERNGLRHGEFALPFAQSEVHVRHLAWNANSTILAVWLQRLGENQEPTAESILQLYTVGNYHWYLKFERRFAAAASLASLRWHSEDANRLYMATTDGRLEGLELHRAVSRPAISSGMDQGHVAVIDGPKLLLTACRQAVVPPPMAQQSLQLPASIVAVDVQSFPTTGCMLAAVTADGQLTLGQLEAKGEATLQAAQMLPDNLVLDGRLIAHLCLLSATRVAVIVEQGLWVLSISSTIQVERQLSLPAPVTAVTVVDGTLFLATREGKVFQVNADAETVAPMPTPAASHTEDSQFVQFPEPVYDLAVVKLGGNWRALGRSRRNRFYVNEVELCNNCNSFALRDDFLLLTTTEHRLHCWPTTQDVTAETRLPSQKAHEYDGRLRAVERGAELVVVPGRDIKAVLQMPRGNLEAIYPMALVVFEIRRLLSLQKWRAAFLLLRRHRVSLNLMIDHDPTAFESRIDDVVRALDSSDFVNLLIMELKDEDTTQHMYLPLETAHQVPAEAAYTRAGKVNKYCLLLREACTRLDEQRYLHSILTTCVKHQPPLLEEALRYVLNLRKDAGALPASTVTGNAGADAARSALKYLLLLVDVQQLYRAALASYDLKLALIVAQVAQMDPREYVPFLQRLDTLSEPLRAYEIELFLKRFPRAFEHLLRAGPAHFAQACELVERQHLHAHALRHLAQERATKPETAAELHQIQRDIALAYGEVLVGASQMREAALMFIKAEALDRAAEVLVDAGAWRQLAPLLPQLAPARADDLRERMRESLDTLQAHRELGAFVELCCLPVCTESASQNLASEALEAYCQARAWADALRLAAVVTGGQHAVQTALVTHHNGLQQQYSAMLEQLQRHTSRLDAVRVRKVELAHEDALGLFDEDDEDTLFMGRDSDLFSQASSVKSKTSRGSSRTRSSRRSTSKSSKGRRRHEAKKFSLKEGGMFEEEALLHELARLGRLLEDAADAVREACEAAVSLDLYQLADQTQDLYNQCRQRAQRSINHAWTPAAMRLTWLIDMGASPVKSESDMPALLRTARGERDPSLETQGTTMITAKGRRAAARSLAAEQEVEFAERPLKPRLAETSSVALDCLTHPKQAAAASAENPMA